MWKVCKDGSEEVIFRLKSEECAEVEVGVECGGAENILEIVISIL